MATYTDATLAASNRRNNWAQHTHAVDTATGMPLCGRVRAENLCGDPSLRHESPTCPTCLKRDPRQSVRTGDGPPVLKSMLQW
jgi:hypothetical protein